jgi:hypothetical protein
LEADDGDFGFANMQTRKPYTMESDCRWSSRDSSRDQGLNKPIAICRLQDTASALLSEGTAHHCLLMLPMLMPLHAA